MIIKKTSWHYKLIQWFGHTPSDSLCPYVRQILLAFALSLFLIAIASCIFIVFVWNPLHVLAALMGIVSINANALMIGLVAWAVYAIVGIVMGGKYLRKKYREKNPVVEKEPNIVMAYIKAKKDKICPTLNFE
jgi:predicted membrane protein